MHAWGFLLVITGMLNNIHDNLIKKINSDGVIML